MAFRPLLTLLACALLAAPAQAAPRWVGVWATAVMPADAGSALPDEALRDATLRQRVRVTADGRRIRLRLTNDHGTAPLVLGGVHVALAADKTGKIAPGTDRAVTFAGRREAEIAAGAYALSDPVELPIKAGQSLNISIHFTGAPAGQTLHHMSQTTGWLAPGDQAAAATLSDAKPVTHWWQIAGVEAEGEGAAVAILGDSLTDGHGATLDADDRWPDVLADRLKTAGVKLSVLNLGISGNRLTRENSGPSGLSRLDRDILSQPGLATVILFEGTNDLGKISREGPVTPEVRARTVRAVIEGYQQVILRAHARGVRVLGATLMPFGGTNFYRSDADAEADRQAVNTWIRTSGKFDGVIDFDAVVRDPAAPERLSARYDLGDRLHLSPAGYRALAEAAPLALLNRPDGQRVAAAHPSKIQVR
jgi:lysophospholipase L1-like esterase